MTKHLFILGAGASASITDGHKENSNNGNVIDVKGLPVGSDLIKEISKYNQKALFGYISCIISLIVPDISANDMYHSLKYFKIGDLFFSSFLPKKDNFNELMESISRLDKFYSSEDNVIKQIILKFYSSEDNVIKQIILNVKQSCEVPNELFYISNISFHHMLEFISLNTYFFKDKHSSKDKIEMKKLLKTFINNLDKLNSFFEKISEVLSIKSLYSISMRKNNQRFSYGNLIINDYIKNIHTFFDEMHTFLIEKIKLSNNEDCLIKWKSYFKNIYLASYIIEEHNPPSIDYFMHNFELFSNYKKLKNQPMNSKLDLPDIETIEKYIKFIICDILLYKQYIAISSAENQKTYNYVRQIVWVLSKEAKKANKPFESYVDENVNIINFNYDHTFKNFFQIYTSLIIEKIYHVYGNLNIRSNNQSNNVLLTQIYEDQLFEALFNSDNTLDKMEINIDKLIDKSTYNQITITIENILEQCDESISWIRCNPDSKEEQATFIKLQATYIDLWNSAENIYFLGFGFDKNNIDNLGIKKGGLRNNQKLFVSKGSARIKQILIELFSCLPFTQIDDNVFTSANIVVSNKPVNKAIENDFNI